MKVKNAMVSPSKSNMLSMINPDDVMIKSYNMLEARGVLILMKKLRSY